MNKEKLFLKKVNRNPKFENCMSEKFTERINRRLNLVKEKVSLKSGQLRLFSLRKGEAK